MLTDFTYKFPYNVLIVGQLKNITNYFVSQNNTKYVNSFDKEKNNVVRHQ